MLYPRRLCWIVTLGLLIAAPAVAEDLKRPAMPRVKVSEDGKKFVLDGTKKPFVPWGFNYLGVVDQLAEDDWDTAAGWERIEKDFREMKKLGANVVRWHLQFETFMDAPDKPKAAQLARLKKLLELARDTGLYLDLTGLNCFRLKRIPDWYDKLSETDRWTAQAKFWGAIAETCGGHPAVFCYDLINEPVIGEPKAMEHPWVTGELGGFHFVQRICNKPAGRNSNEIAEAWVKLLVTEIRKHDSETLVTVGVIPWAFVWEKAKPVFYSPNAAKHLDFVSIHVYPTSKGLEKEKKALAVYDIGKPLVIEETFPLACRISELDQFIDASADRVDGWIAHYFGATPAEHRAGAKPGGVAVAEFLDFWQKKGESVRGR